MKLEGRDRKVVIAGGGLALAIVIIGYVIMPMMRTWSDNQDRLTSRRGQIAALKDRAKSQEALTTRRNALSLRLGSVFGVAEVPSDPPTSADASPSPPSAPFRTSGGLAGYIEQTAKKSGIKIERITPRRTLGGKAARKHFRSVTLQVKVEANPKSLLSMLSVLEGGEFLVRIDSLQLRRDIKKGDKIDATFEVVGYEALGKAS